MSYLTLNTGSELICFAVALVTLPRVKEWHWRSMMVLMLLICTAELWGIYVKHSVPGKMTPNEWIYNGLLIFQAGFSGMMFYYLLKPYLPVRFIIIPALIMIAAFYVYENYTHGLMSYHQLTNTVLLVTVAVLSLLYFYYLLTDTQYVNLLRHADFWWVTGIFFFYFGTTACNVFYHQLAPKANDTIKHLTYYIYNAFIIVLYGCWSYAFICKKWQQQMLPR